MAVFALIIFANFHLLSYSSPIHTIHTKYNTPHHQYHCNSSYPCINHIFHQQPSHHINIHCHHFNSCNNISIIPSSPSSPCNIHCKFPNSCMNIKQLTSCQCTGYCPNNPSKIPSNRRLLAGSDDNFLSNLPEYVYMAIIGGLVLICGILLCIMYCKWRNERIINENNRARANHPDFTQEEQRSLSEPNQTPQLITGASDTLNDTNYKQNTLNIRYDKNSNHPLMLSPESVPLSDNSDPPRTKSPFTLTTFTHTPSPDPYIPQSPYNKQNVSERTSVSNSNVVSGNDTSHHSQFSSQQSSQPHPAVHIMMQPVPSPNTTPQSQTNQLSSTTEISSHHRSIINNNKRRKGYNQDSLSMSSISIPYNNRKESITTSNKHNAIKEEKDNIKQHIEMNHVSDRADAEDIMVHKRRNKKGHFALNLPENEEKSHFNDNNNNGNININMNMNRNEHEKRDSHISIQSIPLDRISVMAPQQSVNDEDMDSDGTLGMGGYQQNVLKEEEEPIFSDNSCSPKQIDNNNENGIDYKQDIERKLDVEMDELSHKKSQKKNKIVSNDMIDIDKDELAQIFNLNEDEDEDEDDLDNDEPVSDHESEFEKEPEDKDKDKKRKRKKKKKDKKKKKKKKKKKRKKKKRKNAVQKEEFEYEPDFVADMEGTAANHHPPQHVMGVSPQELANQVAMDQEDDNKRSMDVQSTVSSHPAFDAKNLKHFMEFVDEDNEIDENEDNNGIYGGNRNNAKQQQHEQQQQQKMISIDGRFTGREYKDDDEESMSSGTSNSMDEYSYSTSNESEYIPNDQMSLASADPYPLHNNFIDIKPKRNKIGFIMGSIKENEILMAVTPNGDDNNNNNNNIINDDMMMTPNGDDNITPNGDNIDNVQTPNGDDITPMNDKEDINNNNDENKKKNGGKIIMVENIEFLKSVHDALYEDDFIDNWMMYKRDIYGMIISFMGRHDRWLHCRLVCKLWNELVYNKYWIFTQHVTMEQADMLNPGDKVDHRDDAGRFIKSTIICRNGTNLKVHYDGWSSKWDSWCDYAVSLHRFAISRSISRCPRVRGKHIEEKMFVDIKPSYRHGIHVNWRKGKVRRLDDYSGQIEVIYKFKQKKYLLWIHLDNKSEVDRLGKHTNLVNNNNINLNINNNINNNRYSNYSLATTATTTVPE